MFCQYPGHQEATTIEKVVRWWTRPKFCSRLLVATTQPEEGTLLVGGVAAAIAQPRSKVIKNHSFGFGERTSFQVKVWLKEPVG